MTDRKTTKPTPGPWSVEDIRDNRVYSQATGAHYRIQGQGGFSPALILGDGIENRGLAVANAKLIAAAGTAATECEALGFDGVAALQALPEVLGALYSWEEAIDAHAALTKMIAEQIRVARGEDPA